MGDIRIIITSKENGEEETVMFTDELEAPVEDFITPGHTVDIDEVLDIELPSGFPLNYTLDVRKR